MDNALALSDNFNRVYKSASNRLRLLGRMKRHLTVKACKSVSMIIPLLTYGCPVDSIFTNTQIGRFTSLERRAKVKIPGDYGLPNIRNS